jgi:hypothetical protein
VKETTKGINFIRNIIKMTDPGDDGLRMPIPPASLKIKKPKKKKKWSDFNIISSSLMVILYKLI